MSEKTGPCVVVDASVAVKWLLPEEHSGEARRLLTGARYMVAPDLLYAEVGNVLWKRSQRGLMKPGEARLAALTLGSLAVSTRPSKELLSAALDIACDTGASTYDSLYLALARLEGLQCVTADLKLYNRIRNTALAESVEWIVPAVIAIMIAILFSPGYL